MRHCYLLLLVFWVASSAASPTLAVAAKNWIHGSRNCAENKDPAIDVLEVSSSTYILRQNKCIHVEAPFIYVLSGKHTVFVQDTGATESAKKFPIYATIQRLIDENFVATDSDKLKILVTHSHNHSDHTAGDNQFRGQENVVMVEGELKAIVEHFNFPGWPRVKRS